MKKLFSLLAVTGFVTQVFSTALTVSNGGFESGTNNGYCSTGISGATGWHSLKTTYGSNCSPTDQKDGSYGCYYLSNSEYWCAGDYAHGGSYFGMAQYNGFYGGTADNRLPYQQMSNNASSNTCYRATAYVKRHNAGSFPPAWDGETNKGFTMCFVPTSVGSSASQIMSNVRSQTSAGTLPIPTYTSVGNGWYAMTVDWTPPSTTTYYIVIGWMQFCDDGSINSPVVWYIDDVSITCLANAGVDKSNSHNTCCSTEFTSVTIGSTHSCSDLSYSWSPTSYLSCPTCSTTWASPHSPTVYTLTTSGSYCITANDAVSVTVGVGVTCCTDGRPAGRFATSSNENSSTGVTVFPNPNNGIFKITVDDGIGTVPLIKICDLQGKTVFEKSNAEKSLSVDLSKYSKGTYIITIDDGTNRTIKNLIKE